MKITADPPTVNYLFLFSIRPKTCFEQCRHCTELKINIMYLEIFNIGLRFEV